MFFLSCMMFAESRAQNTEIKMAIYTASLREVTDMFDNLCRVVTLRIYIESKLYNKI
jgi:hypothetical protein